EVKFEKDQGVARTVLHVDNSLPLYMYFDLYGSTQAIKLRGTIALICPVCHLHNLAFLPRNNAGFSISLATAQNHVFFDISTNTVRDEANGTAGVPLPNLLDDDFDENNASSRTRPVLPPRRGIDEAVLRRTVDDLLTDAPPVTAIPRPPPLAPRPTPLLGPLPAPPSRPPPPTPTATGSSLSTGGTSTSLHSASSALVHLSASSTTRAKSAQLSVGRESSDREEGLQGDDTDECTVCMSARVNSALYKCGHSCMCYDCAMQTYRSSGLCPLCRASIMDVIKIFKA
ncbi:zinc finger, C3HC4 type, partial [Ancylostoma duodenale]